MSARMCALQPLCDHWSMLMMGFVDVNEGKFCPASGLKFFSRQVRDSPYYFLGGTVAIWPIYLLGMEYNCIIWFAREI